MASQLYMVYTLRYLLHMAAEAMCLSDFHKDTNLIPGVLCSPVIISYGSTLCSIAVNIRISIVNEVRAEVQTIVEQKPCNIRVLSFAVIPC